MLDIEVCKNRFSENETDSRESVTGRFPEYAYPDLNKQEKDAWRKAAIKKSIENNLQIE